MSKLKEFTKGFTIFHVVGLAMMIYGAYLPGYESNIGFGDNFAVRMNLNMMSIAGFLSFWVEIVKARWGNHDREGK